MKRILIVEDESSISDFVKGELEYEGYEVCIKEDGREGLEEALNNEYDLVILDIMLPGEDGVSLLKKIKASSRTRDIPVIMATAKSVEYDKIKSLDMGADDYLVKPFGMMEMVSRIKAVLRRCMPKKENKTEA